MGLQGLGHVRLGRTHSTVESVLAGFDQEMPGGVYLGASLKAAVEKGDVPMARVDDMVHRVLRTEFACGVLDEPRVQTAVNPFTGADVAQRIAEQSIVLLKNADARLPLDASGRLSIAVIGSHADRGVLSGGGSDQVDPAGGNAVPGDRAIWHPSSPLKAIRAKAPNSKVAYDPGTDFARAAKLAAVSDVAIVFAHQHTTEGADVPDLSLPDGQSQLIAQVAAVNPHTVVVLEAGGPVAMPWINNVAAVLQAWFPGIRGGEAMAGILFGQVNPSARLPVTMPNSEADLPQVKLPHAPPVPAAGPGATSAAKPGNPAPSFDIHYAEGLKVGYKWFDAEGKEPLFPFGFGLSYTTYSFSELKATAQGDKVQVSFNVSNSGQRAGAEIAQVYVSLPSRAGEPPRRLVAWEKVYLEPGQTKTVSLAIDPLYLSIFDTAKDEWQVLPGDYRVFVGGSSRNTPIHETVHLGR